MKNDTITLKNPETGSTLFIERRDITLLDWGVRFFVDNAADAYRAAYIHRHNKNGVRVEFFEVIGAWAVTVFNERGKGFNQ